MRKAGKGKKGLALFMFRIRRNISSDWYTNCR